MIDTVNKTEKSKASNQPVDTPKSNKTDKVKAIYKSRSTQRTDIEKLLTNQGFFQELIYPIKIPEWKTPQEYIFTGKASVFQFFLDKEKVCQV